MKSKIASTAYTLIKKKKYKKAKEFLLNNKSRIVNDADALAKTIIEKSNGSITAISKQGQETTFTIKYYWYKIRISILNYKIVIYCNIKITTNSYFYHKM